jgi:hypothetical protein
VEPRILHTIADLGRVLRRIAEVGGNRTFEQDAGAYFRSLVGFGDPGAMLPRAGSGYALIVDRKKEWQFCVANINLLGSGIPALCIPEYYFEISEDLEADINTLIFRRDDGGGFDPIVAAWLGNGAEIRRIERLLGEERSGFR